MSKSIADLNTKLFVQIEMLENEDMTDEELNKAIKRSEAVVKVADVIIKNANLALEAQKQFDEYGTGRTVDIPLLGISNEGLMIENKNLRRRLADKEAMYD